MRTQTTTGGTATGGFCEPITTGGCTFTVVRVSTPDRTVASMTEKSDVQIGRMMPWGRECLPYEFSHFSQSPASLDAGWIHTNASSRTECPQIFGSGRTAWWAHQGPVYLESQGRKANDRLFITGHIAARLREAGQVPAGVRSNLLNSHTIKIKDVRLDLAVEAAELPETVFFLRNALKGPRSLLRGSVEGLTRAVSLFGKGNVRRAARELGLANWQRFPKKLDRKIVMSDLDRAGSYTAEKWLELRYGWLPLLYSMQDAWEEARRILDTKTYLKTFFSWKGETEVAFTDPGNDPYVRHHYATNGIVKTKYKTGAIWKIDGMPEGVNLGLVKGNILHTVWQMGFLTFMVDKFWNVSNTLQALSDPMGATFVDGYESTFIEYTGAIEAHAPAAIPHRYVELFSESFSPGEFRFVHFMRTVLGSRPVMPPYPWFGDLDGAYYADVAALWRTFSRRSS